MIMTYWRQVINVCVCVWCMMYAFVMIIRLYILSSSIKLSNRMKNHSVRNFKTVQNPNNKEMYDCMIFSGRATTYLCAVFCSYAQTYVRARAHTIICSKNGRWQLVAKQKINEQENKYHKLSKSGINPTQHRERGAPHTFRLIHTLCV